MALDSLDRRLLAALQQDAGESLERLGARVGLSRNACWTRIKRLEEAGVVKGRVAVLDAGKVGLGLTVFIALRTDEHGPDWRARFADVAAGLPEIQGVYRMAGDLDYLLLARLPDVTAYDALYEKLTNRLRLADVSANFVMQTIKETTALPLG